MANSPASPKDGPALQPEEAPRLPYEAPRLEVYGGIRQLTNMVGMTGLKDGGSGQTNRTSMILG